MAGWTFGTTADYARSGVAPATAAPLTWLIAAQADTLGSTMCPGMLGIGSGTGHNFRFQINVSGAASFLAATGGSSGAATVNTVTAGVPFWVIGRARSATDRDTVLNGDLVNLGTSAVNRVPVGIDRVSFGKQDNADDNLPFLGVIFYSAMWNTGLADADVTSLASGAYPPSIQPGSLIAYWHDFSTASTGTIPEYLGGSPLTVTGGSASSATITRLVPSFPPLSSLRPAMAHLMTR